MKVETSYVDEALFTTSFFPRFSLKRINNTIKMVSHAYLPEEEVTEAHLPGRSDE